MEFSGQEYWSGLPFPSPDSLPHPGIKPRYPTLQGESLPPEPQGSEAMYIKYHRVLPQAMGSLPLHLSCGR